jgi:hypothetical protein
MNKLSRRELESTKLDLRQWSQRLLEISQELTALAADLGRTDNGGDNGTGGGHRPGQPRRPDQ